MGKGDDQRAGGERHPLTDAQAEKWLGSRYGGHAALAFGLGFELVFEGALDVMVLTSVFAEAMDRHESFSMRFEPDGSAQIHEPPSGIVLQRQDFERHDDPAAAYRTFCGARLSEPFDPARPPLVRAWLCRLGPQHWRLFFCAHHLVGDGWSFRILLQDLAARYNHRMDGSTRVPRLDSWIDYVREERSRRMGPSGEASLRYWLQRYRELPEPLRLPTDYPRKPQLSFAAATIEREIAPELWQALRATARRHGMTRFGLLLAGYFILLHRLTGQDDFACGVPFTGAARGAGVRVVGDTEDTLPLRMQVAPDEPVAEFVGRVRVALQEAMEHQDVSLGRIVRELKLVPEPGRMVLLESTLTLNPAVERLRFHDVDCQVNVMPYPASAWELAWQWRPMPGRVALEAHYHSDLFHPDTVSDWCAAYVGILEDLAQGEPATVADVGCSASALQSFALVDDRAHDWIPETTLPELLADRFAAFGKRCAAQCGEREISYAELDRASAATAAGLLARGVGQGSLVGICMPRSIDMLVAVLAVLRSGAAYVPLDPVFPGERLQWMAEHSRLETVIAADATGLPGGIVNGRRVLTLDELARDSNDGVAAPPPVAADDLAYVLYTSGSTGKPKGVRILHRNLANFLCAMQEAPGFGPDDAICAATTLSFDIAALELFLPLLCGGRVVIADDNEHRDPEALARLIERRGCSVLQTTPSLLSLLREVGRDDVLRPLKLLVGGEAFPVALANTLLPHCRELWNMYGPTETTVWSSVARLEVGQQGVPLGKPVANTRIYLLDPRGRPSLPGALGEIWIGGAGVAAGYLHRADLSAERFVEDPFAVDGSRMYRTGDIGRIRGGQLHFHGRLDEQIKLRGYRIEPGEIEAVAAGAGIAECVAAVRDAGNGDQVLVLYVASEIEPVTLAAALRERLVQALPPYMRPQHIVVLPALPRTPNGKIDRRALPAPTAAKVEPGSGNGAPRDALERDLCNTWQRLLQCGQVGIHDNFFSLGGYSLLAVRMFAELHERHGVDLPLSMLIEYPTIAGLAQALRTTIVQHRARGDHLGPARPLAESSPLVELRPQRGTAAPPPLFLIHAVGGNVLNYLPIARAIGADRAVYGLQSPGLDGGEPPLTTIEAMADRYADEIRRLFPQGPYLLAGGSMGGVLAMEVARRLQREGGEISLLGLIDTYGPGLPGWSRQNPWRPHVWWSLYRRLDPEQRAQVWHRIRFRLWRLPLLRLRHGTGHDSVLPQELRIHAVEKSNQAALFGFRPIPYRGRIVLFRALHRNAGDDPMLGWGGYVDGADVIELAGRHDNIIEQPELALRLRECIDAL